MPTYAAIADVETGQYQNPQDIAAIWGDVRADLEEQDCQLKDSYVLLGGHDLLIVFEAEDSHGALQASIACERYGINMQAHEATPIEDLGELVDDL